MDVTLTHDPTVFARAAAAYLAHNAVLASFVVTALDRALSGSGSERSARWAFVADGAEVIGTALQAPPYPTALGPMPAPAAAALAEALLARGPVNGVTGEATAAEAFARAAAERSGRRARVVQAQGAFVLDVLRPPDAVPGRSRGSTADDVQRCHAYLRAFRAEAMPHEAEVPYEAVAQGAAAGRFVVWEDAGGVVSLAGMHAPAYGVGRVGPVYTPPEHRRRGFGAAVSAAATQRLLDGGARNVVLFTDLANPTSNRVYARIGFRRVGDAASWQFDPA